MAMTAPTLAPGAGGAPQNQPQQRSFRKNTRSRLKNITSVPIALNSTQTVFLPQIGLLSMVYLIVAGTFKDTAAAPAGAASVFGPWNLLKRIRVNTNLGAATIVDVSGYGAFVNAQSLDRRLLWNSALSGVTNDPFYQYPTGAGLAQNGVYPFSFCLPIPIAVNRGANFALGLINLQAPQIQVSVDLVFGSQADITTSADAITVGGNVYLAYQYWEIPPPMRNVALPANVLVRTLEQRLPYSTTGEQTYVVPRMGRMLTCYHTVSANGALVTGGGSQYFAGVDHSAPAAGIDYQRMVLNQTDEIQRKDYLVNRIDQRLNYSDTELPAGVCGWNFFEAMGEPRRGDFRDALDTQAISEIDSIIAINSGVALGAGSNFIDTVRTVVQPFQVSGQ